jgi:hypothetical protein
MEKKTVKHIDPFLGEIILTQVGETNRNLMGESRVNTIYTDERDNYWISTWTTTGGDPIPPVFLRRSVIDKILEIESKKTPNIK